MDDPKNRCLQLHPFLHKAASAARQFSRVAGVRFAERTLSFCPWAT